ncbi:hypothetical protein [Candidatus Villigracilis saccharophilus]|uniref:hypothetical protein n=1 Tax=Candidatus Villigracilis saccharophilus TaxID=3140684 RepID=UPI0031357B0F|nr:hypothetical protein [Anaerolineales bacterium]
MAVSPCLARMGKSVVFVPGGGDQARGMVDLVDMQHEHAFSESDVRLLTTLANAMSVALENARLFDETQRLLKVTEERAAELGAISKVSQALIVESELDSTIQLIGSQMREIFSADIVYLALLQSADESDPLPISIWRIVRTAHLWRRAHQ